MDFKNLKAWFHNENIIPLRKNISALLESCNEITAAIPSEKLKSDVFKSDAHQILYNIGVLDYPLTVNIIAGKISKVDKSKTIIEVQDFFKSKYHLNTDLVALGFDGTYKVFFSASNAFLYKTYVPLLYADLAIAYPDAFLYTEQGEMILSIRGTIDF